MAPGCSCLLLARVQSPSPSTAGIFSHIPNLIRGCCQRRFLLPHFSQYRAQEQAEGCQPWGTQRPTAGSAAPAQTQPRCQVKA